MELWKIKWGQKPIKGLLEIKLLPEGWATAW